MSENKNQNYSEKEGAIFTDLMANLFTELACLFRSLSRISQTCLNLKDQLKLGQDLEPSDKLTNKK